MSPAYLDRLLTKAGFEINGEFHQYDLLGPDRLVLAGSFIIKRGNEIHLNFAVINIDDDSFPATPIAP